jgi:hypothetical protein
MSLSNAALQRHRSDTGKLLFCPIALKKCVAVKYSLVRFHFLQERNMLNFRTSVLASLIAITLASPSFAENRSVTIVNNTGYTMTNFYGSNTGADTWQEDILGTDTLPSGSQVTINFDDASGYCKFDFKAVFDDGDELVREDVNVCEVGTFTYD